MPYASASATRSITVQNVVISLTVDNTKPKAGETIKFTGKVTYDTTPLPNRSVNLYLVHPTGSPYWIIASGTTDSNGNFTASWTVPYKVTKDTTTYYLPCTTWIFRLCDTWTGTCSSDLRIPIAYPTALEITTDKDVYAPGQTINVSTKLVYATDTGTFPLPNATITFKLIDPTRGVVDTKTATTDTNGEAKASFTAPSKAGSYQVKAEFGGMGYGLAAATPVAVLPDYIYRALLAVGSLAPVLTLITVLIP
jgi:uncharacterized protein YfaS (alpha-2-macroglobulin family)